MGPKYEFTGKETDVNGMILKQIRRINDGLIGGWIEDESNLSQVGSCFVYDMACVCQQARVVENAEIRDNVIVSVFENPAKFFSNAFFLLAYSLCNLSPSFLYLMLT